jgi:hypothetical protein
MKHVLIAIVWAVIVVGGYLAIKSNIDSPEDKQCTSECTHE